MEPRTKYILYGLAIIAVGTGGYFLYKNISDKKTAQKIDDFEEDVKQGNMPAPTSASTPASLPAPTPSKPRTPYKPKPANSTFPLKRGSKGTLVKDLQTALVKKHGGSILPKYGADGYYGGELEAALISKGLPTQIDSDDYGKIIAGNTGTPKGENKGKKQSSSTYASDNAIADDIYAGVMQINIDSALRGLFKIGSVNEYIRVNEKFKKKEINGVSKTIVTALSHAFPREPERTKYRGQLYRIGLKWRNSQWELSGLYGAEGKKIMTIRKTKVWQASGVSMTVPAYTILGTFRRGRNGLTEFKSVDGRILYVQTMYVKYMKNDPGN